MIFSLQVILYFLQGKPGWFELFINIEFCLIKIMRRFRMRTLPKWNNGLPFDRITELNNGNIRMASYAVTPLKAFHWTGIIAKNHSIPLARSSGTWHAIHVVAERFAG